ncbi:MAG: hypothetical protein J5778_04440 [Clostridiales bacterium]|nr:hypothetical protein [Clostridiales bacterium]
MENNKKLNVETFVNRCLELVSRGEINLEGDFATENAEEYFYNSLVFCLLDAVFSMGAHYKSAKNVVINYANRFDLNEEIYHLKEEQPTDYHKIEDFIKNYERFQDNKCKNEPSFAKCILKNTQRTSSTGYSILKAEACYKIAQKLQEYKINTISEFREIMREKDIFVRIKSEICSVTGQSSGIMFNYLCMLAGDDYTVKPDRWIKRFLNDEKIFEESDNDNISDDYILELFISSCEILKKTYSQITPRYLDYQIWKYKKSVK